MELPIQNIFGWLNIAGILVFAASGALIAARRQLDFIAAWFFALITATGGGTLRDLLIGAPVFWMIDPAPVILCSAVAGLTWAVPLHWWPNRALEWLDAAGLAAFSVYGAGKAMQIGIPPIPAVAAGVITACIGGVIRDITAGSPSILLRNEIYVTASFVAAAAFVLLAFLGLATPWPSVCGFTLGFALRGAAIRWNLALPSHRGQ